MITRHPNPPKLVFCSSDACNESGQVSIEHPISEACRAPVAADTVVCDRHSPNGQRFAPHRETRWCENPLPAGKTPRGQSVGAGR